MVIVKFMSGRSEEEGGLKFDLKVDRISSKMGFGSSNCDKKGQKFTRFTKHQQADLKK